MDSPTQYVIKDIITYSGGILTPEALAALKERIKTPPDDGGLWTGPKIARWFAKFHGLQSVHDQRGWDALIAIGYSIQQPRPRHPDTATEEVGAVAATVIDGETASRCAKNGAPASDTEKSALQRAAGLRSSSGRSWRATRQR
jgi:hypothetical protein